MDVRIVPSGRIGVGRGVRDAKLQPVQARAARGLVRLEDPLEVVELPADIVYVLDLVHALEVLRDLAHVRERLPRFLCGARLGEAEKGLGQMELDVPDALPEQVEAAQVREAADELLQEVHMAPGEQHVSIPGLHVEVDRELRDGRVPVFVHELVETPAPGTLRAGDRPLPNK